MKTYICKQPVELSRKDFDRINDLFKVNFNDESPKMEALIDKLDARPDTNLCTFWWDFEDGSPFKWTFCPTKTAIGSTQESSEMKKMIG